jgi:hypothetical protein
MSNWKVCIVFAASILLSGCGVTPTTYAASQEMLRGSAGVRNDFVQTCITRISRRSLANRQAIAKVMNVSVQHAPRIYCQRLTRGITSGRLKHADLNAGARGQLTPAVVRVLQGR